MPNLLPLILISTMWTVSLGCATLPFLTLEPTTLWGKLGALVCAPPIFVISFLVVSGLLSRTAQHAMIRGRFPRQNFHRIYFWRRIYGCCWTTIFYFKPLYYVFLSIPILKKTLFRLFGYKGPLNFTIYPDTWVRDLPLLHFGEGSYCSNRSTIGSNMCLKDGAILVDRITLGDRALLGHLAMIGPGVILGNDVEVGAGCALGIRCHLKEGSRLGAGCALNHGTVIGARTEVTGHSCFGLRAEIGPDLKIPLGAMIPRGAIVLTQADVEKYISTESENLRRQTEDVAEEFKAAMNTLNFHE
jgi:acetyltransferase-like isoleucine patch superfamily enzyme